ncbi:MAG: RNA polymerase sigma factor, partial [Polyangiaceae bacterium]|nr:RNA polymerase sigma factor [Polyangiaceae bacterium]
MKSSVAKKSSLWLVHADVPATDSVGEPAGEAIEELPRQAPAGSVPEPIALSELPAGTTGLAHLADAELVTLGSRGNRKALELLYRRHVRFALHLATRIEGSPRDAEDTVHDAFIRAFERLGDLSDPAVFRSWLGSIVVRQVRSRLRRLRLMRLLGLARGTGDEVELDALASDDASPIVRAQIAQIYALLQTMPVDERIAWTLRSVEHHDLDTVARLTKCSLATVKRRISRARQFLDEHFVDPHHRQEA